MAKVHKDENSLYVKVGGYIARPVFPVGFSHVYDDGSEVQEGEKVTASHNGGKLATVAGEKWYIHGQYLNTDKSPNEIWKPDLDRWK